MFQPQDILLNPTVCNNSSRAISQLAQAINQIFNLIAQGEGSILRFRLNGTLAAGGVCSASILAFDGGGFSVQRSGVVYDEEPGGFWTGSADDEGWCTARDGAEGEFSVLFMAPIDQDGNINQAYINMLLQLLTDEDFLALLAENETFLSFFETLWDVFWGDATNGRNWNVQAIADIAKGDTGSCRIYLDETYTGIDADFKALYGDITQDLWSIGFRFHAAGTRYVAPGECA